MAHHYIRSQGLTTGSNNGTNWTNAWKGFAQINWASVAAGDTLWVAGCDLDGTYTDHLDIGAGGSAGNVLTIQRVRSSDAVPVAAAGWNAAFDSHILHTSNGFNDNIYVPNGYSYVTIDGRTWHGWEVLHGANHSGVSVSGASAHLTLRYLQVHGPPNPETITRTGDCRNLDLSPADAQDYLLVQYCDCYDADSTAYITTGANSTGGVVEYCWFHNANSANAEIYHQNLIFVGGQTNLTIRYNKFFDVFVESIFIGYESPSVYIYGNLFWLGRSAAAALSAGDTPRGIETDEAITATTNLYAYNNTMYDLFFAGIRLTENYPTPHSYATVVAENNIFWNAGLSLPGTGHTLDYNFFDTTTTETHGIGSGSNPFTNAASADFTIVATISASYPRNKGTALAGTYATDFAGNSRSGLWSMGAFEYGSGGGSPVTVASALLGRAKLSGRARIA